MAETKRKLALGLDSSTQKLGAVVIDIDSGEIVLDHALDYRADSRLSGFGINSDYIVPPRWEGDANQPPQMYFASIDAMCTDLKEQLRKRGLTMDQIVAVNVSGQQHGHVYFSPAAKERFGRLNTLESAKSNLVDLLGGVGGSLSYGVAPIWMTSDTGIEAEFLRHEIGGKDKMIRESGSDSPLRFTGAKMMQIFEKYPNIFKNTDVVQLISSAIPAILTANLRSPMDFGNGSGTSLMNYEQKDWSRKLLIPASRYMHTTPEELGRKLPDIVAPNQKVGNMAAYFVQKYGFSKDCMVLAGSGDNPQTKVLVIGDLLSMGTSIVNMVSTGETFDMTGLANSMYDGVQRPFKFGCRTNGMAMLDAVRAEFGVAKKDYAPGTEALKTSPLGSVLFFWHPKNESFPPAGSFDKVRVGYDTPSLAKDYPGLVDSMLAAVWQTSQRCFSTSNETLYVAGGPSRDEQFMRRVAAMWSRPVIGIGDAGAALGAAVAAASTYLRSLPDADSAKYDPEAISAKVLPRSNPILPNGADIQAYHGKGRYLDAFKVEHERLIAQHPSK